MTTLPKFETYGDYSSGNYGAHALHFTDAQGNEFWFSYQTLVAFRGPSGKRYVRENDWGTTTGKHLNRIDGGDKKSRVSGQAFKGALSLEFGQKLPVAS